MICKQTDLLYQVSMICESELLKSARLENILKECDVRVMGIHCLASIKNEFVYTVWNEMLNLILVNYAKTLNNIM